MVNALAATSWSHAGRGKVAAHGELRPAGSQCARRATSSAALFRLHVLRRCSASMPSSCRERTTPAHCRAVSPMRGSHNRATVFDPSHELDHATALKACHRVRIAEPTQIGQSSASAAAKASTASNSSGAKDRTRNSSRWCRSRSARSAPRSSQPSSMRPNTPLSRPALGRPRTTTGCPQLNHVTR